MLYTRTHTNKYVETKTLINIHTNTQILIHIRITQPKARPLLHEKNKIPTHEKREERKKRTNERTPFEFKRKTCLRGELSKISLPYLYTPTRHYSSNAHTRTYIVLHPHPFPSDGERGRGKEGKRMRERESAYNRRWSLLRY